MTDTKKLNIILGIIAVLILVLSFSAFAYSLVPKGDADLLVIDGIEYSWTTIFSGNETVDFTASGDDYSGIPVNEIILTAGVENPEDYEYKFIGLDGYQKDVTWEDVQNGFLVEDQHIIVFPHMTRSPIQPFSVRPFYFK